MKKFSIEEVLIYNPELKSKKKKPIESDIQQAKIMAFYPKEAVIEQKCNCVGMAEGVYQFCDSLISEQYRQNTVQTIFMDSCCLVQKQVEENIWLFVKLVFDPESDYNLAFDEEGEQEPEQSGYISDPIPEQILEDFLSHFYYSFRTFYGKIGAFLFLENLSELERVLEYFICKYQQINGHSSKKEEPRLCVSSYMIKNIRAIPLEVNTTLKFDYFKNVMQDYDPSVREMMIFANGYLAYTSLDKKVTEFYARYLFGTVEPFKFESEKIDQKFTILPEIPSFSNFEKYGTIFNSIVLGYEDGANRSSINDRSSVNVSFKKQPSKEQDLLGIEEKKQIELPDAFLKKNGEEVQYKVNYFLEKNMLFLTFYHFKGVTSINQLIFANRFFHDNTHKFSVKISEVLTSVLNQNDNYRFLFANKSTCVGKCTLKDWAVVGSQIAYTLNKIKKSQEGQVATTYQNHWVYGIKRMNRILILLVPNEIALHKLEDFTAKMTKEYFFKCFM